MVVIIILMSQMSQTPYEKEFLALRYALMTQSSDSKVKTEGYKNLINYCKNAKWVK